ncbi:hypothetical protein SK128_012638 [Halocaridina rubra]|uniref:Photolyase/cryptochrome alpha/beta domain-containing protein n=1 Tax=Halocaridina rubra TaxID=373956 RepID=A0AAN8ZXJ3_HALRR
MASTSGKRDRMTKTSVHWFRHGLRLHDNPALLQSICDCDKFYPVFIFDGETAGTKVTGYNRAQFLTQSLADLDKQFRELGTQLYVFKGDPVDIFRILHNECGMSQLTFEQDCEAIWNKRDDSVRRLCDELGITIIECISHTLWDPFKIIEANGGHPPLTYEMFLQVSSTLGMPPRPSPNPEWYNALFGEITDGLARKLQLLPRVPTPEEIGVEREGNEKSAYVGGETAALAHLEERLRVEEDAFRDGYILPNQVNPDLLGPPMSMSAALRFGCLSVRK